MQNASMSSSHEQKNIKACHIATANIDINCMSENLIHRRIIQPFSVVTTTSVCITGSDLFKLYTVNM